MGRDPSAVHGRLHRASGFRIVMAVAEPAMSEQWSELDESLRNVTRIEVRKSECLHAG